MIRLNKAENVGSQNVKKTVLLFEMRAINCLAGPGWIWGVGVGLYVWNKAVTPTP
jgi:hypothetical protein